MSEEGDHTEASVFRRMSTKLSASVNAPRTRSSDDSAALAGISQASISMAAGSDMGVSKDADKREAKLVQFRSTGESVPYSVRNSDDGVITPSAENISEIHGIRQISQPTKGEVFVSDKDESSVPKKDVSKTMKPSPISRKTSLKPLRQSTDLSSSDSTGRRNEPTKSSKPLKISRKASRSTKPRPQTDVGSDINQTMLPNVAKTGEGKVTQGATDDARTRGPKGKGRLSVRRRSSASASSKSKRQNKPMVR